MRVRAITTLLGRGTADGKVFALMDQHLSKYHRTERSIGGDYICDVIGQTMLYVYAHTRLSLINAEAVRMFG